MALYLGIPFAFTYPLSEYLGPPGITQTLGGALLAGIAGGLGMRLYNYG